MTSRRLSVSAFLGLIVWAVLWFVPLAVPSAPEALAARLLLLAPLVLVPLLLDALAVGDAESRVLRVVSWALWPGALAAVASFFLPTSPLAGGVAALWLVPTSGVAWWGGLHLLALWRRRGVRPVGWMHEAVLAIGALGIPGGAAWLVMSRAGIDPGPYGSLVVLLTAVHFHYAAFVAPMWAGLLGRASLSVADLSAAPRLTRAVGASGLGLVAGTPLVAVGIAVSGGPAGHAPIETLGVIVLTLSAIALGVLGLLVAPRLPDRRAGFMVAISAGSLVGAMALSLWFNVGARLGWASPDLLWMLSRHGWLNGIGFGLWGALGWRRWARAERL